MRPDEQTRIGLFAKALRSASFPSRQQRLDRELCDEVQRAGCPCGGVLHVANYRRWCLLLLDVVLRWSFCCAVCRRRRTPPSVRFMGRRHYGALIVVLLSAAGGGVVGRHVKIVAHELGLFVSEATLARWASWWRHEMPTTPFWMVARARFGTPLAGSSLAEGLLNRFRALDGEDRLLAFLEFLSPLTTTSCDGFGRRFSMAV